MGLETVGKGVKPLDHMSQGAKTLCVYLCTHVYLHVYVIHIYLFIRHTSDSAGLPLGYPVSFLEQKAGSVEQMPCAVQQVKRRGFCPQCVAVSDWVGRKTCSFSGKLCKEDGVRFRSGCLVRRRLWCVNVTGGPHLTLNAPGFLYASSSPWVPGWWLCLTA